MLFECSPHRLQTSFRYTWQAASTQYDIRSLLDDAGVAYDSITVDNIYCVATSAQTLNYGSPSSVCVGNFSYTYSNGIVTMTCSKTAGNTGASISGILYVVY